MKSTVREMLGARLGRRRKADKGFSRDRILQKMMTGIMKDLPVSCFIETGTYRADTTHYVAGAFPSLEIHSCELNEEFYNKSRQRLAGFDNVELRNMNSTEFIKDLIEKKDLGECPLFFLDAHWYDYWPLQDEVRAITHGPKKAIFVVHDFQVPGRDDFSFDIGGGGSPEFSGRKTVDARPCNMDLIRSEMNPDNDYRVVYPGYTAKDAHPEGKKSDLVGHVIVFQNMEGESRDYMKGAFPSRHYKTVE